MTSAGFIDLKEEDLKCQSIDACIVLQICSSGTFWNQYETIFSPPPPPPPPPPANFPAFMRMITAFFYICYYIQSYPKLIILFYFTAMTPRGPLTEDDGVGVHFLLGTIFLNSFLPWVVFFAYVSILNLLSVPCHNVLHLVALGPLKWVLMYALGHKMKYCVHSR